MTTTYLGSALENQNPRERTNEEVMVGGLVKLSPEAAEQNRRALRRMRGAKTVEGGIYRETPAGEEIEIPVVIEYRLCGSEPDVGIMSGYVEVQDVFLQNEDGSEGASLNWSQTDQDDFHERTAFDLCEEASEYDGPDTWEEARGER